MHPIDIRNVNTLFRHSRYNAKTLQFVENTFARVPKTVIFVLFGLAEGGNDRLGLERKHQSLARKCRQSLDHRMLLGELGDSPLRSLSQAGLHLVRGEQSQVASLRAFRKRVPSRAAE